MSETIGRLLAAGNVAEVFEWGSHVVKLYRFSARKPAPFREAAIHAAVEAMALPVNRTIHAGIGGAAATRRGVI
jgi:hypothetical protein